MFAFLGSPAPHNLRLVLVILEPNQRGFCLRHLPTCDYRGSPGFVPLTTFRIDAFRLFGCRPQPLVVSYNSGSVISPSCDAISGPFPADLLVFSVHLFYVTLNYPNYARFRDHTDLYRVFWSTSRAWDCPIRTVAHLMSTTTHWVLKCNRLCRALRPHCGLVLRTLLLHFPDNVRWIFHDWRPFMAQRIPTAPRAPSCVCDYLNDYITRTVVGIPHPLRNSVYFRHDTCVSQR